MTQAELATVVGVGWRTVSNWENGHTIPKNRLGLLRQFFGLDQTDSPDPIRAASEVTLLAELMRRATERASRAS